MIDYKAETSLLDSSLEMTTTRVRYSFIHELQGVSSVSTVERHLYQCSFEQEDGTVIKKVLYTPL